MGTNYYVRTVPCPHCNRSDGNVHICKSLCTFRGYRPLYEDGPTSPWGPITTWADWKRVLREHAVQVVDEYGDEHEIEQFISQVEAIPMESRRRQYDWVMDNPSDYRETSDDWLDPDGFSFYGREFS